MIAMRSHSASASFRSCVVRSTVCPSCFIPAISRVQLAARLRVEPCCRLVQKDELGLVDEGQSQRQPLPLSARQRVERRVGLVEKREALEERRRLGLVAVEGAEEGERLARRDLVLQGGRLQRRADLLFHLARPSSGIDAADLNRTLIGLAKADDAFDRRRLAGTVRPDEPEDLPVADLKAHASRRFDAAVALLEIADGDFWWHRHGSGLMALGSRLMAQARA